MSFCWEPRVHFGCPRRLMTQSVLGNPCCGRRESDGHQGRSLRHGTRHISTLLPIMNFRVLHSSCSLCWTRALIFRFSEQALECEVSDCNQVRAGTQANRQTHHFHAANLQWTSQGTAQTGQRQDREQACAILSASLVAAPLTHF